MNPQRNECQYGKKCYRKNSVHFQEYSHPHIEAIMLEGKDQNNKYTIPDEYLLTEDIILEQLKLTEPFFEHTQHSKRPRTETNKASSSLMFDPIEEVERESKFPKTDFPQETFQDSLKSQTKTVIQLDISEEDSEDIFFVPETNEAPIVLDSDETEEEPFCPAQSKKIELGSNPTALMKLEASAPYNFFLVAIKSAQFEPLSMSFAELLCPSLGELEASLQINFVVHVEWLLELYKNAGYHKKPLLIVRGGSPSNINDRYENVLDIQAKIGHFGTHHTKMMVFWYKDRSVRVVVSTANLYQSEWSNNTQGLWISPTCPEIKKPPNCDFGESPTGFRADLIEFLESYKVTELNEWTGRIRKSNFEKVNVFFIGSTPGNHQTPKNGAKWGHLKVGHILSKHCSPVPETCAMVAQSSTMGNLGPSLNTGWVMTDIGISFSKDSGPVRVKNMPPFKMVYPSAKNVKNSDGGAGVLLYGSETHSKHPWINNYLHQWKSDKRDRSRAIPHIKTYFRYSDDEGVYWFCLTSSNFSKSAWGTTNKAAAQKLRIPNYEAGVLFIPKFVTKTATFPLKKGGAVPPFPLPYDVPFIPYDSKDHAFLMDKYF